MPRWAFELEEPVSKAKKELPPNSKAVALENTCSKASKMQNNLTRLHNQSDSQTSRFQSETRFDFSNE